MPFTKVESSMVETINASKVTGVVSNDRFPAALPAVDGSALTNIAAGGSNGKILQVIHSNGQSSWNVSNSTYDQWISTYCYGSITPSSTSSKVIIMASQPIMVNEPLEKRISTTIFRGTPTGGSVASGTNIGRSNGLNLFATSGTSSAANYNHYWTVPMVVQDSPSTTSATTYFIAWKNWNSSMTSYADPSGAQANMILMEVA